MNSRAWASSSGAGRPAAARKERGSGSLAWAVVSVRLDGVEGRENRAKKGHGPGVDIEGAGDLLIREARPDEELEDIHKDRVRRMGGPEGRVGRNVDH